jgi:diguanylate cyclase (GGDEF)-like protein
MTNTREAPGTLATAPVLPHNRPTPVWFVTVLVIAAAAHQAWSVATLPGLESPEVLRWPWFVLLVVAAEFMVTHLQFRRLTHSLSMGQIPIVVGLFFLEPWELIVAEVLGLGIAALIRREVTVEAAFSLAQRVFIAGLSINVFFTIMEGRPPVANNGILALGSAGWIAAISATALAVLVGIVFDSAVFRLAGGRLTVGEGRDAVVAFLLATAMNTGLALVGVQLLWVQPGSAWLALVPPFVLFGSYRAYVAQRAERQRLESLYAATQELHESVQIEAALIAAAENARGMFGAGLVEVTIFPDGLLEPGYATIAGPDGASGTIELVELGDRQQFWDAAQESDSASLLSRRKMFGLDVLDGNRHEFREAMVAPLSGEDPTVGMILVANGRKDTIRYTKRDLTLLDTLAPLVSVSLKNGQLEDSLAQVTLLKDELRHQASHDILTGLPNRALFAERLQRAISACDTGEFLSVLYLDLDDFKTVNDSLGHEAGDDLLKGAARKLVRASRPGDTVARLGGDEFGVLLSGMNDTSDAEEAAQRILKILAEPMEIAGREIISGASVGISFATQYDLPAQALAEADAAMYVAKRDGKAIYRVFEQSMHEDVIERLELKADLGRATLDGQLRLLYQPIVDVPTGLTSGLEALVRWEHPTRGLVGPDKFISFAEEHGLIIEIGTWVLEEAVGKIAHWRTLPGQENLTMAINISPIQLIETHFPEQISQLLRKSDLDPSAIVLEITENVLANQSLTVLEQLKALGIRLAIDDFGTGYSSLSYLERLPFDIMKVDKAFVGKVGTSAESALFRAMLQIGKSMGLRTIVEGVETPQQLLRLRELGGDQAQGYHFARPMEESAVDTLLGGRAAGGAENGLDVLFTLNTDVEVVGLRAVR